MENETGDKNAPGDADQQPSLDPRTWGKPPPDKAAPAAATPPDKAPPDTTVTGDEPAAPHHTSFDVRSWGASPTRPPPEPVAPAKPDRRALIFGSGAALVVGIGGGALFLLGRKRKKTAPASPGAAPTPNAEAASGAATAERRVLRLASAAELQGALAAQGIPADQATAASAAARPALRPGDGELRLEIKLGRTGAGLDLMGFQLQRPDGSGVAVTRGDSGFAAQTLNSDLRSVIRVARGQMDNENFYSSAVAAGVNDSLIPEFAQAFAFDFDFQREIKPGDVFETAYEEQVNGQGQALGAKRLLYAALSTPAKSSALYRFTPPGGAEEGWYDGAGRSNKRGLMRTPVEGARISSSFGLRTHPVLGFQKLHKGTDFAAPIGTPIYASGDGVVTWAAMKGANGNLVILQHDNGWQTYYLHMNAFGVGVAPQVRVRQGQEIGQVGTTGRSTGPHLHYELHINGEAVDAMAVQMDEGRRLEGPALEAFNVERDRIDALRRASV